MDDVGSVGEDWRRCARVRILLELGRSKRSDWRLPVPADVPGKRRWSDIVPGEGSHIQWRYQSADVAHRLQVATSCSPKIA